MFTRILNLLVIAVDTLKMTSAFSSFVDHLTPSDTLVPIAIFAFLILVIFRSVYLRAFPKPLPGIPYDTEAAKTLLGDISTLKNDPDGLAKWCSRHLNRMGSPVAQVCLGD